MPLNLRVVTMSNYPDDCQYKKCPWDCVEAVECSTCHVILNEDEVEQGFCNKHKGNNDE